jgi:hypothetical protein
MVRFLDGHTFHWMRDVRRVSVSLLCLLGLSVGATVDAQEMSVPLDIQVQLMVRVFSFDRAMAERVKDGLTVGILYQERYRTSANTADEVEDLLRQTDWLPGGRPDVVRIRWEGRADAERQMREHRVRILYIAPLRSVDIPAIGEVCAALRIPAFTGVPDFVDEGISLGVTRRGGKAAILVNLPSARRAGADLSSQLLHIAEVTGE